MQRASRVDTRRPFAGPRYRNSWTADWLKPAIFAVLALAVLILAGWAIQRAVSAYHDSVALAGRSSDPTLIKVVVAGEILSVPANMIRFPAQRRGGGFESLELLLHWPSLEGYSEHRAEAFRDGSTLAPLIYVTISPRDNPLDADARLIGVYKRFFTGPAIEGPSGLVGRHLSVDSGYRGEDVFYANQGSQRFVARCLAEATAEVPATCIRDINIGAGLTMLYRFNRFYLGDWRTMDAGLRAVAARF